MLIPSEISLLPTSQILSPQILHWSSSTPSAILINLCNDFLCSFFHWEQTTLFCLAFCIFANLTGNFQSHYSLFLRHNFAYALVNIITITEVCTHLVPTLQAILGLFVWKKKLKFYRLLYLTYSLHLAFFYALLTLSSHSQPQNMHWSKGNPIQCFISCCMP